MAGLKKTELLKNDDVKKEIEKHKYFESQKAGRDIGWDKAAEDWLNRYSAQWVKEHMTKKTSSQDNCKSACKDTGSSQTASPFKWSKK